LIYLARLMAIAIQNPQSKNLAFYKN
jgi:hypothetical protein